MSKILRQFVRSLIKEENSKLGVKNKSVNVSSNDELAKNIEPDLIDMIKNSYSSLGGHPKINEPRSLINSYDEWVVADVDDDPEPDVAAVGSKKGQKVKLGAIATDGGPPAKNFLLKMKNDILRNGWWGETSGAVAHMAINKLGLTTVDDETTVRKLLGKEIDWLGPHPEGKYPGTNGWYRRAIGGISHVKIIVGDI